MESDRDLSTELLKNLAMSFMSAGRDTTVCTLCFVFYLLSTHQKIQDRVVKEIEDTFKSHPIAAVVLETLTLSSCTTSIDSGIIYDAVFTTKISTELPLKVSLRK